MATTRLPVVTPLRWLVVGTFVNRAGGGVRFLLILYLTTARGFSPATAGAAAPPGASAPSRPNPSRGRSPTASGGAR